MAARRGYFLTLSLYPGLLVMKQKPWEQVSKHTVTLTWGHMLCCRMPTGSRHSKEDLLLWPRCSRVIQGQRRRPGFSFPYQLGNPALLEREQGSKKPQRSSWDITIFYKCLQFMVCPERELGSLPPQGALYPTEWPFILVAWCLQEFTQMWHSILTHLLQSQLQQLFAKSVMMYFNIVTTCC